MANGLSGFFSGLGDVVTGAFRTATNVAVPALVQTGVQRLVGPSAPAAPIPTISAGLPAPAQTFFPQPLSGAGTFPASPAPMQTAAAAPMIRGALQSIRSAIAALVAKARVASGLPWSAGKIKRFAKEFGITAAATATGLGIADIAFIAVNHKSPRMNVGNVKALRRSMRRIEGFHRLCQRADMLRSSRRGGSRRGKHGRNGVIIAQN